MKKVISSRLTFFYKFILPSCWLVIGLYALLNIILNRDMTGGAFGSQLFIVFWLVISVLGFYWSEFSLKKVSLDSENLYVSNYLKEAKIPLGNIVEAEESVAGRFPARRITLTIKESPAPRTKIHFGPRIFFTEGQDVTSSLKAAIRDLNQK